MAYQPPPKLYTKEQWATAGGGWWLHALITLAVGWTGVGLIYPIVQFTRWQAVGGESVAKRALFSTLMAVLLFMPLAWIGIVPWSRQWYWRYRQAQVIRTAPL